MKIFGIGLSHTGTRSLDEAFKMLGLRSTHYPLDRVTYLQMSSGVFRLDILEHHDAMSDIGVSAFFEEFDRAYPDSRFILTVREKQAWMRSMERINRAWLEAERVVSQFESG